MIVDEGEVVSKNNYEIVIRYGDYELRFRLVELCRGYCVDVSGWLDNEIYRLSSGKWFAEAVSEGIENIVKYDLLKHIVTTNPSIMRKQLARASVDEKYRKYLMSTTVTREKISRKIREFYREIEEIRDKYFRVYRVTKLVFNGLSDGLKVYACGYGTVDWLDTIVAFGADGIYYEYSWRAWLAMRWFLKRKFKKAFSMLEKVKVTNINDMLNHINNHIKECETPHELDELRTELMKYKLIM